ncbi:MAG: hypothetical protein U0235_16330 [Polyangiaceae bacterium]
MNAGSNLCQPKTCQDQGFECGKNSDGCGNLLDCGACSGNAFCGGGGFSKCGGNAAAVDAGGNLCKPKTCQDQGIGCGDAGDGCGHVLHCGACNSPQYCGGGGYNQCGGNLNALDGGSVCVPKKCGDMGIGCGPAGDGCGNLLDCGGCTFPAWCGGGGFAKCGGNLKALDGGGSICVPKDCAAQGKNCGPASDGCGHQLQCGDCTLPQICGGGGQAGVCGGLPCTGLCQNQVTCPGNGTTRFKGRVVAGTQGVYGSPDPVPNVVVYVPNGTVQKFSAGVQCSQCGAEVTGNPLVQTTTDYLGNFSLDNVPVPPSGKVPVVIQLGRWRRQLKFDVTACTDNVLGDIHMPRNHNEGDIPLTAISTGSWDAMECVLLKMGIDESEFTVPGGGGRIEMYQGNGVDHVGTTPDESVLTETLNGPTKLDKYDQVLLPCWGEDPRVGSHDYSVNNVKSATAKKNLVDYTKHGGRVFATHFSYAWLFDNAPFDGTATWVSDSEPTTATANIQTSPGPVNTFYQWMNALSANGSVAGQFTMNAPRYNFSAIDAAKSTLWVNATDPQAPTSTRGRRRRRRASLYSTRSTRPSARRASGRVVFSAFHVTVVTSQSGTTSGQTFPDECVKGPMSPQEKALEYLIWDLASCVPGKPVPSCTPRDCASQGLSCGPAGDGCGNPIDCGTCQAPATCGGAGEFAKCGYVDGGTCAPRSCAQQGIFCGPAGDGRGKQFDCGRARCPRRAAAAACPAMRVHRRRKLRAALVPRPRPRVRSRQRRRGHLLDCARRRRCAAAPAIGSPARRRRKVQSISCCRSGLARPGRRRLRQRDRLRPVRRARDQRVRRRRRGPASSGYVDGGAASPRRARTSASSAVRLATAADTCSTGGRAPAGVLRGGGGEPGKCGGGIMIRTTKRAARARTRRARRRRSAPRRRAVLHRTRGDGARESAAISASSSRGGANRPC